MAIKKKFIDVELPLINETVSVLGTPESLIKKVIKLDLSRKLKGKGLQIDFIIESKDENLYGLPKKLVLMQPYIKRMMRRGISYVEDSFETKCKDIRVRIKPFLITRKKVSRAVKNNLRRTTKETIVKFCEENNFLDISKAIYTGELQKNLHPKLKKIYPLSLCEIRSFEIAKLTDISKIQEPVPRVGKKLEIQKEPNEKDLNSEKKEPATEKKVKPKKVKKETKKISKK